MEKRLLRIEIAIGLLLFMSLYIILKPMIHSSSSPDTSEQIDLPALPDDLTKDYLNKTVYQIKTEYNSSDWEEFYNVFGDFAKTQISLEDIAPEFSKLKAAIGNIGAYSYSHYTYDGNNKNAEWFDIFYKCRFERGKGTIQISTRTLDQESEIVGINFSVDEF